MVWRDQETGFVTEMVEVQIVKACVVRDYKGLKMVGLDWHLGGERTQKVDV